MKKIILICNLLLMSFTKEGDELAAIDQLITLSQRQLETEQHLKTLMLSFKEQQEAFFQGDQTLKSAGDMVATASAILNIIDTHHYRELLPPIYLEELEMFSSIARKNGVSRP